MCACAADVNKTGKCTLQLCSSRSTQKSAELRANLSNKRKTRLTAPRQKHDNTRRRSRPLLQGTWKHPMRSGTHVPQQTPSMKKNNPTNTWRGRRRAYPHRMQSAPPPPQLRTPPYFPEARLLLVLFNKTVLNTCPRLNSYFSCGAI